jgi:hypothetical protein
LNKISYVSEEKTYLPWSEFNSSSNEFMKREREEKTL